MSEPASIVVVPTGSQTRPFATYERSPLPRTTTVVIGARARGSGDQTPSRGVGLKRNLSIALRSRFGSDRTGRGFVWLYEYDAGWIDALARDGEPVGVPASV